jgi:hypothetical protein
MSQVGKLLFALVIASICFAGSMSILALSISAPIPEVNLGNASVYTDPTSAINVTGELLTSTGSYGLGFAVVALLILASLIVLASLSLIGRKHR